jgi:hypothetical protein
MSHLFESHPATLGQRLHDAREVTPALMAGVIEEVCGRSPSDGGLANSKRIGQLVRLGAWTDAALALIDLALPQWKVRRLCYDGGEWYCALSREREMPDWLDNSVEGRHSDLALALLSAFVEVKGQSRLPRRGSVPASGRHGSPFYEPVCCDSFG